MRGKFVKRGALTGFAPLFQSATGRCRKRRWPVNFSDAGNANGESSLTRRVVADVKDATRRSLAHRVIRLLCGCIGGIFVRARLGDRLVGRIDLLLLRAVAFELVARLGR